MGIYTNYLDLEAAKPNSPKTNSEQHIIKKIYKGF